MSIYCSNIENDTMNNNDYRRVIFTGNNSQLVLMSLKPREEIGMEIHNNVDQFFRIEHGKGKLYIGKNNETSYDLSDGSGILVPSGTWHNIINTSNDITLKLYTIYSPPNHPKDRIQHEKPVNEMDGGNKEININKLNIKYY